MRGWKIAALFVLSAMVLSATTGPSLAQETAHPSVDDNGAIHGTLTVPVSDFLSPEANAQIAAQLKRPSAFTAPDGIEGLRKRFAESSKIILDKWLKLYPAKIESTTLNGVHVYIVTPDAGIDPRNKNRVLINAHRGGFVTQGEYGGQIEAVAMAGRGHIKVIAVDYRMAPEHTFPAASEDMDAVYRAVLKTTKPSNIGLYGCSAGGALSAQSVARFQKENLPRPGAIGIFCAGAMKGFWEGGDSSHISAFLNGTTPSPPLSYRGYFDGVDTNDPQVTPGLFPDVLAKFPPTLLVSGTRDVALSNVVVTHARMLQAGVDARLFVQEGLGHGYFFNAPGVPESATALDVIWTFFDAHLGR